MVFMHYCNKLFIYAFYDKLVTSNTAQEFVDIYIPEILTSKHINKTQIQENKNKTITCINSSNDGGYIALTTEAKQLVIYTHTFKLIKNILLQKAANKVCFTPNNQVLVADRNGDVYSYSLENSDNEPVLLLGHLSVVLDMVISPCGKYIITCDRDEKIRVSCYPNAYNIVRYCLGHKEFVTKLKLLKNDVLLSASGDGTVRMWNYLEGKELNRIETYNIVDSQVFNLFALEMDKEKVEVTTLPISDMQVCENKTNVIIAISLYKDNKIHFYKLIVEDLTYSYLTNVLVDSDSFYYFLTSELYIISSNILIYYFVDNKFESKKCSILEEKLSKYMNFFQCENNTLTLLYKRRFNNVQEYLNKKRQRLESKENKC